ncbi:MAG TPA: glycosyltransferase family 2 protein [Anaeromyxobacteraceae bacterium]|nr:glycosyltransferase family 2 protein [Anaeromyxobacteraceae bacterium]
MAPLLSIVTICRNDRPGLERTLASIRAQTWRDFEVELVDGASTDGTADLVRALSEPWLHATSEPDRGIFDAQNKGWRRARGTFCLFLNAGDSLAAPDALARVFEAHPTEDLVLCDLLREWPSHTRLLRVPDRIGLEKLLTGAIMHPSTLIKRDLIDRVGPYDASLRIAADHDFFFRAVVRDGVSVRHLPIPLSIYAMGGISSHPGTDALKRQERDLIMRRYLPPLVVEYIAEQRALGDRRLGRRVRALLRPVGRALRGLSRRLRGLPVEG